MSRITEHLDINQESDLIPISFNEGPYTDYIFTLGKVKLEEKDDEGYLTFDYDIIENKTGGSLELTEESKIEFEKYLGEFVINALESAVNDKKLVYQGGTGNSEYAD